MKCRCPHLLPVLQNAEVAVELGVYKLVKMKCVGGDGVWVCLGKGHVCVGRRGVVVLCRGYFLVEGEEYVLTRMVCK